MIIQSDKELALALSEKAEAQRKLIASLEFSIKELDAKNWELQQEVFQLKYPKYWKQLTSDLERCELLGITLDVAR